MSQHSGGEEKAQFSSTLTHQQGGITGRLHYKKGTVEPKPPYGRKILRGEVFDKRGLLFVVPTG
ncbi:Helicase [Brevibacillus sp. IT-7CA2]